MSVTANAHMLLQFLDALRIDQIDLVGNDSGGGICQIFAAQHPTRVRSLTLTNCDTHDNWPPEAFKPFVAMVAAGGLRDTLSAMVDDKQIYRSPQALGPAYEHPAAVTDDTIETYLRPLVSSAQRTREVERFVNAFDNKHTLAIESRLKQLQSPTLIAWGTDDIYFDVKWSHWLAQAIPGTRRRVELRCTDFLSGGALGRFQSRAARSLAGGVMKAAHDAACTRSVPRVSITVPTWQRLLRQLAIFVGWVAWQLERRRGRLALLELTDDQLKDIGLSRGHADVFVSRRPD